MGVLMFKSGKVSCKLSKELSEIGVRGSFQSSVVSSGVQ